MTRRPFTCRDQHGREWTGQAGLKSGMPTGQLVPSFHAPWYPDQQYLRVNRDNISELWIDYEAMFLRRNARLEQFHKLAEARARQKSMPAPKRGEYAPELLQVCGQIPKALEPVVAAMQGNPWILGLSTRVDPRLDRFVTKPRNQVILEQTGYDFGADSYEMAVAGRENDLTQLPRAMVQERHGGDDTSESVQDATARISEQLRARQRPSQRELDEELKANAEDAFGALDGAGDDVDVDAMVDELGTEPDVDDDLDEQFDSEAVGGKTVNPKNEERVQRSAPRRSTQTTRKKGTTSKGTIAELKRAQRGNRRTLADGAPPVIGGGGL
jgi:hypothetical protein